MELTMDIINSQNPTGPVHIGTSSEEAVIAAFIREALDGSPILDYTIVKGGPCSIRLLLMHRRPGIRRERPMRAAEAAESLYVFLHEPGGARLGQPKQENMKKGWRIERIYFQGRLALLARAVWIAT